MELNVNLITFKLPKKTQSLLIVGLVTGVAGLVLSFIADPTVGWKALITFTFLFISIALFGPFITAIMHVTGTEWGVVVRRIPEVMGRLMPIGLLLLLVIAAGFFIDPKHVYHVYEWSNPEVVAHDKILQGKEPWLNVPFFIIRMVIYGSIWIYFGNFFYKMSTRQDEDGDISHTTKAVGKSALFIVLFALSFSLLGVDLLMSSTPHWFSTMFGVYCFAGLMLSGFAFLIIMVNYLKKQGKYGEYLNENHIHDLGKFMWGFTIFYAYIAFSQFMLIWYAAIPEETFFYEDRIKTTGSIVMILLLVLTRFLVPFFALMNRPSKRNISWLTKIAWVILASQVIDISWILFFGVHGAHDPAHAPSDILTIVGVALASIGAISLVAWGVLKGLEKQSLIPVKDPRLEESLHWHQ